MAPHPVDEYAVASCYTIPYNAYKYRFRHYTEEWGHTCMIHSLRHLAKRALSISLCMLILALSVAHAVSSTTIAPGASDASQADGASASPILPSGNTVASLEALVDRLKGKSASISIGLIQGQQTLLEAAYGYADAAKGREADHETVYEWASVSKTLVWTCIMQLEEQGRLALDVDIKTYLPDGFLSRLRFDAPITLQNLMHHNAGWERAFTDLYVELDTPIAPLSAYLKQSEPRQIHAPGLVTSYSNWNVALAAYIVECVSGVSYADYVWDNIFTPLGMEHTALLPDLSDNAWVREHRPLTQGYLDGQPARHQFAIPMYPVGMVTGTLSDLLRYAKALLPEDEQPSPLFASRDTLDRMLLPSLCYGNGEPRNSHGFWWRPFDVPVVGHMGNTVAFSSELMLHPETKTGLVLLTNQGVERTAMKLIPMHVFGQPVGFSRDPYPSHAPIEVDASLPGMYCDGDASLAGYLALYGMSTMTYHSTWYEADQRYVSSANHLPDGRIILPVSAIRDAVRMPTAVHICLLWLQAAAALSAVYSFAALLLSGAHLLYRIARKKQLRHKVAHTFHIICCMLNLAVAANIALYDYHITHYASKYILAAHLLLCLAYAIAMVLCIARFAKRTKRIIGHREHRKTNVSVLSIVASICMIAMIVGFQLFAFWGPFV